MSVVYPSSIINSRLQVVLNAIDGGAGNGRINLGTAGMATVLATVVLSKPSGVVSGGVLTFAVPQTVTASNSGTPAAATIADSAGNTVISGLIVGVSTSNDLIISQGFVNSGDVITLVAISKITGN